MSDTKKKFFLILQYSRPNQAQSLERQDKTHLENELKFWA